MTKSAIREEHLAKRRSIVSDDRAFWDMLIFERAHKQQVFQRASAVHIYRSTTDEVETMPFIEYAWGTGKDVYVPVVPPGGTALRHVRVTYRTEWRAGVFGIMEPVVTSADDVIDDRFFDASTVIVVPLVAFDDRCHRLGYGKGYYDRFLTSASAPTIGLAYELQHVRSLPSEPHDRPLTCVVTEQRLYVPDPR